MSKQFAAMCFYCLCIFCVITCFRTSASKQATELTIASKTLKNCISNSPLNRYERSYLRPGFFCKFDLLSEWNLHARRQPHGWHWADRLTCLRSCRNAKGEGFWFQVSTRPHISDQLPICKMTGSCPNCLMDGRYLNAWRHRKAHVTSRDNRR